MLHYYGDLVRRMFFFGAVIMLVTLPFFRDLVPVHVSISSFMIVALTLIAALTNPVSKEVAWLNVMVSAAAIVVFEYYAVQTLSLGDWDFKLTSFFWTNHVLAVDFVFALYYSAKTLRGMMI